MIINAYNDSWNLKVFFDSRGRGFKFSLLVDVAVASYSLILSRVSQGALRCLPVHIFHDVFQRFLNPRSMFTNVPTVWNCTIYIHYISMFLCIYIMSYFKIFHRFHNCQDGALRYHSELEKASSHQQVPRERTPISRDLGETCQKSQNHFAKSCLIF
jgi:hypothetical protein